MVQDFVLITPQIERLKAQLTSERTASTDALHAHRKEAETLQLALRKAEKQRAGEQVPCAGCNAA